ncbi:hypothetical protein [Lederbergia citrea]|uniref:hypothetical protein n=1 Tax=Lederbergia citrea TaxID=2833581 RepID=UPI001BC9C98D|nr:hypothetical protein [Lederbergia citrea]MBS4178502.1 hypothetical protein [Lederbergia citrea]
MERNYETRHIFMAIGICIALASPFLLIFLPNTIANIAHHTPGVWDVFVPRENYIVYGIGFLLLFIAAMLLFILDIRKVPIIISTVFVLLSVITFFIASQSYKSLSDDAISYSPLFSISDHIYSWEELDRVIYHQNKGFPEYEFLFNDGNHMRLYRNAYFNEIQSLFYFKLKEINVNIERNE